MGPRCFKKLMKREVSEGSLGNLGSFWGSGGSGGVQGGSGCPREVPGGPGRAFGNLQFVFVER